MKTFLLAICLLATSLHAAELPREVQRELDSFNNGVTKLDTERQVKLNALIDKAVKALNEVSKKAKTVEERRAIDDEIIALQKLRKDEDLLGDGKKGNPWVGRFIDQSGRLWGEISADGTAKNLLGGWGGKWTIEKGRLVVAWSGTSYVDTIELPDKEGVIKCTNDRGGSWTMKKDKP